MHRIGCLHRENSDGKALFSNGTYKDRNHVENIECEGHDIQALVEVEDTQDSENSREVAVKGEDQREQVCQF